MTNDQDLLTVLKSESDFLENGGYRQTESAAWRPQLVFQDSPTCLNFDPTRQRKPCSDCALLKLIPREAITKKFPCRYIPLNSEGETIDSFYRYGSRDELERALGHWLKSTIRLLEKKAESPSPAKQTEIHVRATVSLIE